MTDESILNSLSATSQKFLQETIMLLLNVAVSFVIITLLLIGGWRCIWNVYLGKENWARVALGLPPLPRKVKKVKKEKTTNIEKKEL